MVNSITGLASITLASTLLLSTACQPANNENMETGNETVVQSGTMNETLSGASQVAGNTAAMDDAVIFAILDEINDSEEELGKLAAERAVNSEVREFARKMVTAHEAMDKEADDLADRLNINPNSAASDSLERANDVMEDRLESMENGAKFDMGYINSQVMAHEQSLQFIARAMNSTTNSQISDLLKRSEASVRSHLEEAQKIQTRLQQ